MDKEKVLEKLLNNLSEKKPLSIYAKPISHQVYGAKPLELTCDACKISIMLINFNPFTRTYAISDGWETLWMFGKQIYAFCGKEECIKLKNEVIKTLNKSGTNY